MGDKVFRAFTVRAATADVRTMQFQGRDHLVVPIVALVEGVLYASNAPAPELVTEALFSKMPAMWNGRPVVIDHPVVDGRMVAACSPLVLERESAGVLFNARVENHQLRMEAWLDPSRVDVVGPKLRDMLERIERRDEIEISIGAIVAATEAKGVYKGKPYFAEWVEYASDHLALLSAGSIGACSREMGCGVRAAHRATAAGWEVIGETTGEPDMKQKALLTRMRELLRLGVSEDEMSDRDLRRSIDAALRAKVPGYLGIIEVVPGQRSVVFEAMPGDAYVTMQQNYSVDDAGAVALDGDAVAVEPVTEYRPVGAETRSACGCQTGGTKPVADDARTAQEESTMKTKAERVAALIENPKTSWKAEHKALLENSTDEMLALLEAQADVPAAAPAAAPAPAQAPAQAPAAEDVTLEALLEKASPDVRDAFASARQAAKDEKASLVKRLTDSGRCAFSADQLNAKETSELKVLVGLLPDAPKQTGPTNYTGRGLARQDSAPETVDAPPSIDESIRAARAK